METAEPVVGAESAGRSGADLKLAPAPAPHLAVVIPALDEEATVGDVVAGVPRHIEGIGRVDVIVVDDGSRDRTRLCAVEAGADGICSHPRPRGLVAAFKSGTYEALRRGADIVVNMDADGQHDPGFIPRLIRPLLDGEADIAVGVRPLSMPTDDMTVVRRRGNQIGSWVASRALGLALSDATSGYRAFSRESLLRLNILSEFTYTLDTIIDASHQRLSVAEVPVRVQPRLVGESRMTHSVTRYIRRTGSQAAMGLIRRRLPRLLGWLTFATLLAAVGMTLLFLARYQGAGAGPHLPALLASVVLWILAVGLFVATMLAAGIDTSRRLLEEALYAVRKLELNRPES
jgi:glycosyltransferase involved in cell wall biosynthesis